MCACYVYVGAHVTAFVWKSEQLCGVNTLTLLLMGSKNQTHVARLVCQVPLPTNLPQTLLVNRNLMTAKHTTVCDM